MTNHHLASGFIDTVYRQPILHGRPIDGPPSDKQFELKQWKNGQEPLGENSCLMRLYKEYKRQAFPIGSPWFLLCADFSFPSDE